MSARISSAVARHVSALLGVAADLGELRGAVERDPAHELRRDVVLRRAARLPDALVGLAPDLRRALGLRLDDRPEPPRQPLALARVEQDRVEHRAEDVVLALVERAVADPDRARARVAGEVVARRLGQVAPAVDPVHDLQRPVLGRLDVGDELHELVGLPVEVEPVQRLQRERRVAHPRVAVVPVALAARRLGQRRRERGHRRAGRHVGEALDRERRALDRIAEAVVGDAGPAEPGAPEADRRGDPRVGLVDVLRCGELLGPRQRAVRAVARRRARGGRARGCPRCRARGRDRGGSSGRRRWRRPRAGPVDERPLGRRCGRSRRPARRRARPRRRPRGTRPCARACGRRRRRRAAACAA